MKIQESLFTLISKINKKERKQFKHYLEYKNRKKLISLYQCFLEKEDVEAVNYTIQRKKLTRNLRFNLNELFYCLRKFLTETVPENTKGKKAINLIYFAKILQERGMSEMAIEQLDQVEKLASEAHNYELGIYSCRKRARWSAIQFPLDTETIYKEAKNKNESYIHLVKLIEKVEHYTGRVISLVYQGIWNLNEQQFEFLNTAEKEGIQILSNEGLTDNFKVMIFQTLGYLSLHIKTDNNTAHHYANSIVNTLNDSKETFSSFLQNKMVAYSFLLDVLKNMGHQSEFETRFMELNALVKQHEKIDSVARFVYARATVDFLIINCTNELVFQEHINDIDYFLEEYGVKMSFELLNDLYLGLFEVHFCKGDFKTAAISLENVKKANSIKMPSLKFTEFMGEILLAYEEDSYEFIINRCLSFRRVSPKYLTFNPAVNLFISCLLKVCKTPDKEGRNEILKSFKEKIYPLLSNIRHKYMLHFYHIIPWMESKINDYPTVVDYLKAQENKKA